MDRSGGRLGTLGAASRYAQPRISPDGTRVAFVSIDSEGGNRDLWLLEIATGACTRLTTNPANDWSLVWSPDSRQIAFASDRDPRSSIYRRSVDAGVAEERLLLPAGKGGAFPTDWTRNGRILYSLDDPSKRGQDIFTLRLRDLQSEALLVSPFDARLARGSPDGKWFAYASAETGAFEV